MRPTNPHDDAAEYDEAFLTTQVRRETSRRIVRLAGLYAAAGIPRTGIPAHVLAHIDAGTPVTERVANVDDAAGRQIDAATLTDHALLLADGENSFRFWWGMSWNVARDTPTWWPEAS